MKRILMLVVMVVAVTMVAATMGKGECEVVILSGYPSAPANWDWNNLSLNVDVHTSSANAPTFKTGDNFAEAVAELMRQGYKMQGAAKFDEGGYGCTVMMVK
jgi:hypothetical protein